jgi:regulator of sigma E protease
MTDLIRGAITIVLFLGILGVLVIIHELGHFVVARLAGVRVLEFGIGFPPRARVLRSKGETLVTLNWLPLGGFVKLEGEDESAAGASDPRSFASQALPVKVLILVAGVTMNLLLALVIFTAIPLTGDPTIGINAGTIQPGSPAAAAGIQPGDTVVSLGGRYYSAFEPTSLLADLKAHAGTTVTIGILRPDGSTTQAQVTLRSPTDVAQGKGALGISGLSARTTPERIHYSVGQAIELGGQRTVAATRLVIDGLGQLGSSIVNRPTEPPPAAGPVGVAVQVGDVFWGLGPVVTLFLAGLLSANLAVFNILPIPPLDGGRILVLVLKRVLGQRLSLRAERLTYFVGLVFILAFVVWVTGFDIVRQLGGLR